MSDAGGILFPDEAMSVARTLDFSTTDGETPVDEGSPLEVEGATGALPDALGEVVGSQVPPHVEEPITDQLARPVAHLTEGLGEETGMHVAEEAGTMEFGEHGDAVETKPDELQTLLRLAEEFEAEEGEMSGEELDAAKTHEANGDSHQPHEAANDLELKANGTPAEVKMGKPVKATKKYANVGSQQVSKVRPSTAPAAGVKVHSKVDTEKFPRTKRLAGEDTSDSMEGASQPGSFAVPRLAGAGASRAKLTVPQPFALATEKRASLGGRPAEGDGSRLLRNGGGAVRTALKKPQTPGKSAKPLPGIKALPSEKQDGDIYEDGEVKLEDEDELLYPALKIKVNQPPGGASSFSFKCDERAEKRREYYSKLEERLRAKEAEKTQIQAKTQEDMEAEMRQLRKSLTFKATPMPNFYQETPVPKVEMKKIPLTRAKSPKLATSRRSSSAGIENRGSSSPVGRFKHDHKIGVGVQHKSSDASEDNAKKTVIRKPTIRKMPSEKTSVRAKPNGSEKDESVGLAKIAPRAVVSPSDDELVPSKLVTEGNEREDMKKDGGLVSESDGGLGAKPIRAASNGSSSGSEYPKGGSGEGGKVKSSRVSAGSMNENAKDGAVKASKLIRPKVANPAKRRENNESESAKLVVKSDEDMGAVPGLTVGIMSD